MTTSSNTSIIVAKGVVETASFTNVKKGSLKITKVNSGGAPGDEFTIRWDCDDAADTKGFVLLNGGESHTVTGLPAGTSCVVTEDSFNGYSNLIVGSPATIAAGAQSDVTVTNTRKTSTYQIIKDEIGASGTKFSFTSSCEPGKTIEITTNGTGDGTYTSGDLPTGTPCTITETANPDYTTSVNPANGQIVVADGSVVSVTFTNTKKGALKITKVNSGGAAADEFVIRWDCDDAADTKGSVSLNGGESHTVSGLPAGTSCVVTEDAFPGYSTIYVSSPAAIAAGATTDVTVTNTRNTSTYQIIKDEVGASGTKFSFTSSCEPGKTIEITTNATGDGTYTSGPLNTGTVYTSRRLRTRITRRR